MVAKWNQRASNNAAKDDLSKSVKMKRTRYRGLLRLVGILM
jgi:hypothetical protein